MAACQMTGCRILLVNRVGVGGENSFDIRQLGQRRRQLGNRLAAVDMQGHLDNRAAWLAVLVILPKASADVLC